MATPAKEGPSIPMGTGGVGGGVWGREKTREGPDLIVCH